MSRGGGGGGDAVTAGLIKTLFQLLNLDLFFVTAML